MINDYASKCFLIGQQVQEKTWSRRLEGSEEIYLRKILIPNLENKIRQAMMSLEMAKRRLNDCKLDVQLQ